MQTNQLFEKKKVFSLEIFPPKKTGAISTIYDTLGHLKNLNPDFISVTYGAGGSTNNNATLEISSTIKNHYKIESVAHLPCINLSKHEVTSILDEFEKNNVENILALRGDISDQYTPKKDFRYASDLISFIKGHSNFNIIAACYPEGHNECKNPIEDIQNLKTKIDAGANQLITQLFLDNDFFYRFKDRAYKAGINVPIEAGIMPVVNKKQIERMVSLCGVSLPKKLISIIDKYQYNPLALRQAGISYAIDQIAGLLYQGIDGIHLYTMNDPDIAKDIYSAISCHLAS